MSKGKKRNSFLWKSVIVAGAFLGLVYVFNHKVNDISNGFEMYNNVNYRVLRYEGDTTYFKYENDSLIKLTDEEVDSLRIYDKEFSDLEKRLIDE